MLRLELTQGADATWGIQTTNRDGSQPTGFLSSDVLTAAVWQGTNLGTLFAPTVLWYAAGAGQITLAIAGSQTAGLDPSADYHLQIYVSRGSSTPPCVVDAVVTILPAPGSAAQLIQPYCQYTDLLLWAPWVQMVQRRDTDVEGFYAERLQARKWLDWLIVRAWRGTSAAYFGDAGRSAQFWLGSWVRRTPLPSYWLMNQLAGGFVQTATVTAAGSGYSSAPTVTAPDPPVAPGNSTATLSANISSTGHVTSVFVNTQGYGYTPGQTLTLTLSGGGGTGATATAKVPTGVLILRDQVVRVCALKAASIIGLSQVGLSNSIASHGAVFRDMASAEVANIVAELDLNGDGIADLPIPLQATNTMFT